MAEDAVVESEITLDDFNADEQEPAKAVSTPAPKEEAKAEPEEKPAGEDTKESAEITPPEVPTKETEDEDKTEVVETTDKPSKAEDRKSQLNSEIRDLVAQRNELRKEVEKNNAEVYQPATEEELTEQGMNAIEAKIEAMRQEREMEKYNNQVAEAQLVIGHESERVLQDFPIFNPDSEQYDKELAEEVAELLASNLVLDPNTNQVIGSNVSPYQLYKTIAKASGISAAKGEIKGQRNTEKQLANIDAPSNAAPEVKPKDPLMELWATDD